jgi:hypothetical protein
MQSRCARAGVHVYSRTVAERTSRATACPGAVGQLNGGLCTPVQRITRGTCCLRAVPMLAMAQHAASYDATASHALATIALLVLANHRDGASGLACEVRHESSCCQVG